MHALSGVNSPIIAIRGLTGSGKSALAIKVAEALNAVIISVDSAQIYTGLDIGTAKPTSAERARIPHEMLDICAPSDHYSAADFARDAGACVERYLHEGIPIVLAGGTMLYFHALLQGLSPLPRQNTAFRARLEGISNADLHERLTAQDAARAAELHPNDRQRVVRALEIAELTDGVRHKAIPPWWVKHVRDYVVWPVDRAAYERALYARLDAMLAAGFLAEVAALYEHDALLPDSNAGRAVGYRQLLAHILGECSYDAAVANIRTATRRLAKHQRTWLNKAVDAVESDATVLEVYQAGSDGARGVIAEHAQRILTDIGAM